MSFPPFEYKTEWPVPAGDRVAFGRPLAGKRVALNVEQAANERAAEGWELVSFQALDEGVCIAFRRALVGTPYRDR